MPPIPESSEPAAKKQKQSALNTAIQKAVERSGAAARFWLTSRALQNLARNLLNAEHPFIPLAVSIAAAFLQPVLETIPQLSGATTNNQAAAADAQVSNAPTAQDLASAPAPQLTTTEDPVGITDPAIPISEYLTTESNKQNLFTDFAEQTTQLQVVQEIAENLGSPLSDEEIQEAENFSKVVHTFTPLKAPSARLLGGNPKENTKWIGKFVPV